MISAMRLTAINWNHELGWEPEFAEFDEGTASTFRWFLDNQEWMDHITSGEYEKYYESMYKNR